MYEDFAEIYEDLIEEDFDHGACGEFILKQAKDHGIQARDVLDLGGGSGRLARSLAPKVLNLTLVDPSEAMLELARKNCPPPFTPRLLKGEAQTFRKQASYDLILSVLDVVNYLDKSQVSHYLARSYENLKDRGLLIFDVSTPVKLKQMAHQGYYVVSKPDYFHLWQNELAGEALNMELEIFKAQGDLYERYYEEQTMYLHELEALKEQGLQAGFASVEIYNGYTDRAFQADSLRGVLVLTKE